MKIKAKLNMPSYKELAKLTGLNKHGRVQEHIDSFVFYESAPYLPGYHLFRESRSSNNFGDGKVVWDTNDANFLYEGKLMVDALTHSAWGRLGEPKIMDPKGRPLDYHGGGKRDKEWFDHMINDKMDDLLDDIQHIINEKR